MRAHKSKTVSGGPCTKPRHWCRESRSVSIFFVLDGADGMAARTAGAAMNPENRRKKRSEERRVGKECRSRRAPAQQKKRETESTAHEAQRGVPPAQEHAERNARANH